MIGKIHSVQTNARMNSTIERGQTVFSMMHTSDIKARVEWLKERIEMELCSMDGDSYDKIPRFIDEAFEDVMKE